MQQKMQSCIFLADCDPISKRTLLKTCNQLIAQAAIVVPHTIDMFLEILPPYKGCKCILLEIRYRTGIKPKLVVIQMKQGLWKNHVADTDRGGKAFGKGVKIDNLVCSIHREQGWNRLSLQTKFTVEIIFDNIAGIRFVCPLQSPYLRLTEVTIPVGNGGTEISG